ncbi:MAG: BlaI/MecI/CopY family transcriptional regulator [Planctomycetota bacterium]|nr:BlaI/MecI/CopY family transcriptional regulator [Planctomycetota bacterium]
MVIRRNDPAQSASRSAPPVAAGGGSSAGGGASGGNLPDAELEVLSCLWRMGEGTARQVREALAEFRPMAHGSAVTLLNRLEGKGLVARAKAPVGKAFIYRPKSQPGPTYRRLVRRLLDRVFAGNGVALVASLLEAQPPSRQELDELQQLLDDLRANAGRGNGSGNSGGPRGSAGQSEKRR